MKSITCKEAVELILKKEEGKLSFVQKIKLWRHLAACSLCRIFSIQSNFMNQAMKQRQNKKRTLSEEEKEIIIRNVLQKNEE